VQLDGSDHIEPLRNRLSDTAEQESTKAVHNLALHFSILCSLAVPFSLVGLNSEVS